MGTDIKAVTNTDDVPFALTADGAAPLGRVKERFAIDVAGAMQSLSDMDEAKLARERRGEKIKFLSPSQLPVGLNILKILPPWTTVAPHAGRFWRAVWVHYGLGPSGETKTALCSRRMNKLGLPKKKGEDSLARCVVCEALEAIWAIPFDERTPEEKKFLSDYKPRLSYLFNVVWVKGGGKSHIDDGTQVFTCSPNLGEPILTAFKFVLSMKPTEVPDNFDVQIKKMPAEGKVFNGKQVYDYEEVFPAMPPVDIDLADPKFERYSLDALYKQKDAGVIEHLFRQTPCGSRLLGAPSDTGALPGGNGAGPRALPAAAPAGGGSSGDDDDIPFRHGPGAAAAARPAVMAPAAVAPSAPTKQPAPAREPGSDDEEHPPCFGREFQQRAECAPCPVQGGCEDEFVAAMAARSRTKKAATSRDKLAADLLRAARR